MRNLGALGNIWVSYINSFKMSSWFLRCFCHYVFPQLMETCKNKSLTFKKSVLKRQEFRPLFSEHWPVMIFVKRVPSCQLHQREKAEQGPLQNCEIPHRPLYNPGLTWQVLHKFLKVKENGYLEKRQFSRRE